MAEIIIGCALSDVNRADLPRNLRVPERLTDYVELVQARLASPLTLFELQPEDLWTVPATFPDQFIPRKNNRWWRTLQSQPELLVKLRAPNLRVGVHQPIQNRDALSSNFFVKYEMIEATKQAMEFAEFIDADYFVFHLAQVDKWNWDRQDQMDKAIKVFNVFATYYTAREMKFTPIIETLEFPKFPATGAEAFMLLKECRKALRNTKLAFNLAHLWSSRNRMIATGQWSDARVSFEASLEYALDSLAKDIHIFHVSGAWESETHAIPGLHPQQDPFRYPMKLRESSSIYAESGEMDLNRVLELLVTATTRRGHDLDVVLQIFDRDIEQILEAARLLRHDLVARANAPAIAYRPIEISAPPKRKRAPTRRRSLSRTVPAARVKGNGHATSAKKKNRAVKNPKSNHKKFERARHTRIFISFISLISFSTFNFTRNICHLRAGQLHQHRAPNWKNGMWCPRRCPHRFKTQQRIVKQFRFQFIARMRDGRDAADGEPRARAHLIRVRDAYRARAQCPRNLERIRASISRHQRQHRIAFIQHKHQRFHNLPKLAAHRVGGELRGARRIGQFADFYVKRIGAKKFAHAVNRFCHAPIIHWLY